MEQVYFEEMEINLLFQLMDIQQRRFFTQSELDKYQNHIRETSKANGIETTFLKDDSIGSLNIRDRIEEIDVNGKIVYRLMPDCTNEETSELVYALNFYRSKHKQEVLGFNDTNFIQNLNDFRQVSNDCMRKFKEIDEERALELAYKIACLEKEKRKLENRMELYKHNSDVTIDKRKVETIFDSSLDDIREQDFVEQYKI